jgi:hypothetical protein
MAKGWRSVEVCARAVLVCMENPENGQTVTWTVVSSKQAPYAATKDGSLFLHCPRISYDDRPNSYLSSFSFLFLIRATQISKSIQCHSNTT